MPHHFGQPEQRRIFNAQYCAGGKPLKRPASTSSRLSFQTLHGNIDCLSIHHLLIPIGGKRAYLSDISIRNDRQKTLKTVPFLVRQIPVILAEKFGLIKPVILKK